MERKDLLEIREMLEGLIDAADRIIDRCEHIEQVIQGVENKIDGIVEEDK